MLSNYIAVMEMFLKLKIYFIEVLTIITNHILLVVIARVPNLYPTSFVDIKRLCLSPNVSSFRKRTNAYIF